MDENRIDHDRRRRAVASLAVALALLGSGLAGCGGGGSETTAVDPPAPDLAPDPDGAVIDPGDGGDYRVEIDPADFTSVVDHPYLPKLPGARWRYESVNEDGDTEVIEIEVLDERRTVMGVETIVVHDVVSIDGEVIEDTYDWFAQDTDGRVWYFGEDTTSYEDGQASDDGAWEAGVGGALPGIVMPAEPEVTGLGYRQEYLAGEAEDMGEVIAVGGSVTVPAGTFDDLVVTRDWTPLEPDVVEEKSFARGVGFVLEEKPSTGEVVELVAYTPGRTD
jgi:hypothetical protein